MIDGKAFVEVLRNACKDISLALLQGGRKKSIALDEAHSHLQAAAIIIETLERERDAAVRDLAVIKFCAVCRNDDTKDKLPFACTSCGSGKQNWRWRGVCAENGGVE